MVDMQLPIMEPVMIFQLVDIPPPVPSMVDMLTKAMGRLLLAMDMDMLQLPMADMLLSATDMTLLNMDMDRPFLLNSFIVSGLFDILKHLAKTQKIRGSKGTSFFGLSYS